jgi:acyl-CoA synthetase (AMP-forming)/AMP-acid ligase II
LGIFWPKIWLKIRNIDPQICSKLDESVDLDEALKSAKDCPEPESVRKSILVTDPLLFIYTSGTTGLPKAVVIKHIRSGHKIDRFFASNVTFNLLTLIFHQMRKCKLRIADLRWKLVPLVRVARWFIFEPKIQSWASFGGPCNVKWCYIL